MFAYAYAFVGIPPDLRHSFLWLLNKYWPMKFQQEQVMKTALIRTHIYNNYFKSICATMSQVLHFKSWKQWKEVKHAFGIYLAWEEWYHRSAKLRRYFTLNMVYWHKAYIRYYSRVINLRKIERLKRQTSEILVLWCCNLSVDMEMFET